VLANYTCRIVSVVGRVRGYRSKAGRDPGREREGADEGGKKGEEREKEKGEGMLHARGTATREGGNGNR